MKIFENIISDRGSKYAVSGRLVTTRDEIVATIKLLKKNKKFLFLTIMLRNTLFKFHNYG